MSLIFSKHAIAAIRQRGLEPEWIARTIASPDWTEPEPLQPGVTRSFRHIPEAGNRVLRVVHRAEGADVLVITAFPDRGARK